jgi:hypothetical protein
MALIGRRSPAGDGVPSLYRQILPVGGRPPQWRDALRLRRSRRGRSPFAAPARHRAHGPDLPAIGRDRGQSDPPQYDVPGQARFEAATLWTLPPPRRGPRGAPATAHRRPAQSPVPAPRSAWIPCEGERSLHQEAAAQLHPTSDPTSVAPSASRPCADWTLRQSGGPARRFRRALPTAAGQGVLEPHERRRRGRGGRQG